MNELIEGVETFERDPLVKAILLTGAGATFSAGADIDFLTSVMNMPQEHVKDRVYRSFQGATRALRLCSKPVVAAVNGAAYGAGCEVAVACDFRIASADAVFCENWIDMGAMPPLGGLFMLPRLVGLERASDMVMRATKIGGARAVEMGLAIECVPSDKLKDAALRFASGLASRSGVAMAAIKQGLRRGLEGQLGAEWEFYVNAQAILLAGSDFAASVEGIHQRLRGKPSESADA